MNSIANLIAVAVLKSIEQSFVYFEALGVPVLFGQYSILIDFDIEMKRIQRTFTAILAEEAESQAELKKALKGLGYEL